MFSLIPKEMIFFDLFDEAAKNAHLGALALVDLLENFTNVPDKVKKIKDIEHAGDKITHTTIEKLNQTFITPIDREDIHDLACRLDDILDRVDTAVDRICLYKLDRPLEETRAMSQCLVRSMELIREMLPHMRNMRSPEEIRLKVREVHRLESEADTLERQALVHIFEHETDPIYVIKWKNIIEVLESATDKCEDVANVIEGIVLKNA